MNQAGFTVISGDIGTGKTTLIRQLLNQIDPDIRIGLISNTHQSFGDLMQWIALAFELPYQNRNKVELYQDFMDFIIGEYAKGQRTVLIVDEAQNMSAETLEELRMLSNVNADKDQVLQVILVGQRELRETLKGPDLVQFAQRIGVDYHLEPLHEDETRDYIRHRCKVAGGKIDLFSDQACERVHHFTGGVPRLINQLCDTALVYGYAEQLPRIDARTINDAGEDKNKGGLFRKNDAETTTRPDELARTQPVNAEISASAATPEPAPITTINIGIAAESQLLRTYLSRLLSAFNINVVTTVPLKTSELRTLNPDTIDVLLVELDEQFERLDETLLELLENWKRPVLYNDSLATEASLSEPDREEYGKKLSKKLFTLVSTNPPAKT